MREKGTVLKSYIYGIKKSIPVFFGFLPVAITFAIVASGVGLSSAEIICMSVFVFAGASQIMAMGMLGAGAGMLSIVVATFVLNLRHLIMSVCIFNRVPVKSFFLKCISALSVTDEGFAIITTEKKQSCNIFFVLGVITLTYLSWIFGTVIGVLANNVLPQIVADSFGIALYALFLALIVPSVKGSLRLFITVVLTALINTVLCLFLDTSWAIILSTLLGAAVGAFIVEDSNSGEITEETRT